MLYRCLELLLMIYVEIANICRNVSQQVAVLKRMRNILPFDIRKDNIYMSFIVPQFDYCAQTWHFYCNMISRWPIGTKQNHKTQNRNTKLKTESQNLKQNHKTLKQNRKIQNKITKLKTESQNPRQNRKI